MLKTADTNISSRGLCLQWEEEKIHRQIVPTPRLLEPVDKYSHGGDPTDEAPTSCRNTAGETGYERG